MLDIVHSWADHGLLDSSDTIGYSRDHRRKTTRHTATNPRSCASQRLVLALLVGSAACDVPAFEGGVSNPRLRPSTCSRTHTSSGTCSPDLELVSHNAWSETSWGHFSGIYVNGHDGVLTEEDMLTAWEASVAVAQEGVIFENVEVLTIDGRKAWGWAERLHTPELSLVWIAYRAMVPYDTITYAI